MIYCFGERQKIPSIVTHEYGRDPLGNPIGLHTFYIIREATFEEWQQWIVSEGGQPKPFPLFWPFFYEVTTD